MYLILLRTQSLSPEKFEQNYFSLRIGYFLRNFKFLVQTGSGWTCSSVSQRYSTVSESQQLT